MTKVRRANPSAIERVAEAGAIATTSAPMSGRNVMMVRIGMLLIYMVSGPPARGTSRPSR